MNEFVLNNDNAVEQALDQHEKAIKEITKGYDVIKKPKKYTADGERVDPNEYHMSLSDHKQNYENFYKKYDED